MEALSDLPADLLSKSIEGIYRLEKSKTYVQNPASGHEDQIALYDEAFKSNQNLAQVIAHEFAHKLYRQLYDKDQWLPYAAISEWKPVKNYDTGKYSLVPTRDGFVEEDGRNSIDEDYSNNIEFFLFKPQILKAKNPKIYDWIQKKYGDKFKLGRSS